MELVNPVIAIIGIIVMIILMIIPFGKKSLFTEGKKVANLEMVEQTELYKKLKRRYKILNICAVASLVVAILAGLLLVSRPAKVDTVDNKLRNRDIFLCMDVSASMDELNGPLCERLKEVVKDLDGERFGITIFNGQSVLLVPLTTDYDYVLETLEKLSKSIQLNLEPGWKDSYYWDEDLNEELMNYKDNGTYSEAGSSLIGDGLAGCLYNFVDLEENKDRTRLIIFTTDNDLSGTPFVTLEEATDLCKKNNVKVYGVSPEYAEDEETFKKCMEKTGGKYYKRTSDKTYDELIADIEKTDKSDLDMVETVMYDSPEMIFSVLIIFMAIYFILSKVIKK